MRAYQQQKRIYIYKYGVRMLYTDIKWNNVLFVKIQMKLSTDVQTMKSQAENEIEKNNVKSH